MFEIPFTTHHCSLTTNPADLKLYKEEVCTFEVDGCGSVPVNAGLSLANDSRYLELIIVAQQLFSL